MIGFRDEDDYLRAKEVFDAANYTETAIGRALGRDEILVMPSSELPSALRRTRDPSRLNTLIRLFFLGMPVPLKSASDALAPMPLEPWVRAELLRPPNDDGLVAPRVQFWPVAGLMLAADMPRMRAARPGADFVVPPGRVTLELANAMIRRPCGRTLDLGTGCGILALLASQFADTVVATDKNERAAAFAHFNCRLNRISNVRCQVGDLFEPVAQQRFQLVVCNPPFVISPTQRFLFRDSGVRGDVFCRRLARSVMDYLEISGFFQCTANLAHEVGRPWKSSLEEWFEDLGCDALVLVHHTEDVSDYAMGWILSTESQDATEVPKLYDAWMDYFEQERIEAISYLLITLRRSAAHQTWVHIDDPPCRIVGPCGDELLAFFEARDALQPAGEAPDLLDQRLRLAPAVRIEQEHAMTADGLEVCRTRVKKTGGLRYPLVVDSNVARLLAGCDGNRTIRQQLQDMVACLDLSWDRAVSAVLPVVRSLVERSVLLGS